ncbi:MAG: hypothetical protein QRY71_05840 [Candidatus Rhabdochlamydia sp.]
MTNIVLDSIELKVYGVGEWRVSKIADSEKCYAVAKKYNKELLTPS